MPQSATLADRLRSCLRKHAIAHEAFAGKPLRPWCEKHAIHNGAVGKILADPAYEPTDRVLLPLAAALGVSASWLRYGASVPDAGEAEDVEPRALHAILEGMRTGGAPPEAIAILRALPRPEKEEGPDYWLKRAAEAMDLYRGLVAAGIVRGASSTPGTTAPPSSLQRPLRRKALETRLAEQIDIARRVAA